MTVHCIDCMNFSLRSAGQMARHGYGHCEKESRRCVYQSATFPRHCSGHEACDLEVSQRRRQWLEQEQAKVGREINT